MVLEDSSLQRAITFPEEGEISPDWRRKRSLSRFKIITLNNFLGFLEPFSFYILRQFILNYANYARKKRNPSPSFCSGMRNLGDSFLFSYVPQVASCFWWSKRRSVTILRARNSCANTSDDERRSSVLTRATASCRVRWMLCFAFGS